MIDYIEYSTIEQIIYGIADYLKTSDKKYLLSISEISLKCFLGIIKVCPELKGLISKKHNTISFSYILYEEISLFIILQKIQSIFITKYIVTNNLQNVYKNKYKYLIFIMQNDIILL